MQVKKCYSYTGRITTQYPIGPPPMSCVFALNSPIPLLLVEHELSSAHIRYTNVYKCEITITEKSLYDTYLFRAFSNICLVIIWNLFWKFIKTQNRLIKSCFFNIRLPNTSHYTSRHSHSHLITNHPCNELGFRSVANNFM